ncbi:hypothetical protein [Acinetobacter calcoaceticus]|uniref:hypothetical protein n=1 Tax=Acinetobacter calcoaceticus TaxID=471 RepID=UPI0005EF4EE8|nr:hypothetical protein [Acinetobacter calcoaceticus]
MTYINEYVSTEDRARYKIDDMEKKYERLLGLISRGGGWTIDRVKNSYLIKIKSGRNFDNESGILYFIFYWGELEILVKTITLAYGGERNAAQWCKYGLVEIDIDDTAPKDQQVIFKNNYDAIILDLKHALIAYKDFGILSNSTEFEATFDF